MHIAKIPHSGRGVLSVHQRIRRSVICAVSVVAAALVTVDAVPADANDAPRGGDFRAPSDLRGPFWLRNDSDNTCLSVTGGAGDDNPLVARKCNPNDPDQFWNLQRISFRDDPNGSLIRRGTRIINSATQRCIEDDFGTATGNVRTKTCAYDPGSYWLPDNLKYTPQRVQVWNRKGDTWQTANTHLKEVGPSFIGPASRRNGQVNLSRSGGQWVPETPR